MTTPTIQLIHRHGSIRQYKPASLPAELINTIIAVTNSTSKTSIWMAETLSWVAI